jgi:hypothetical protein
MKKPAAAIIATVVIVNACIWGLVILMSSHTLSGTGAYQQIQNILGGGAGASLIIVGGGFAGLLNTLKSKE